MGQRLNKFQCSLKFGYCIANGMLQILSISMIWANVRFKSMFVSRTTGVPKHCHQAWTYIDVRVCGEERDH